MIDGKYRLPFGLTAPEPVMPTAGQPRLHGGFAGRIAGSGRRASTHTLLVVLIAAVWLATRPYDGIVGDARFYMVQALNALEPGHYADDIYFRFGSQDRFTIFTSLYAPLVAALGVGPAAMLATLLGQLLWLAGLLCLARALIRDRLTALLAVLAVVVLPNAYALFGYGEPFVTPRLYAEALILVSLALMVRKRTAWAIAAAGLAAALHPITALPGLALLFVCIALARPRWWWLALGGAGAFAALALAGVKPFADLGATYDPAWFEVVRSRDAQCLITAWRYDALLGAAATWVLAILTLRAAEAGERRFLGAAFAIGVGGIAATLLGADLARNVLITELQPWRTLWLLTVVTHLCAAPVVLRLLRDPALEPVAKLMLTAAFVALWLSSFVGAIAVAAPLLATAVGVILWQRRMRRPLPAMARPLCLAALSLGATATALYVFYGLRVLNEMWPERFRAAAFAVAVVSMALALVLVALRHRGEARTRAWPLAAAAGLLLVALLGWDRRTAWTAFVESSQPVPPALAAALPENASVYWEGGLEFLWLHWKRPDYFSCSQGTGAVFFRQTALTYQHRLESFWPLRTLDFAETDLCPGFDAAATSARTKPDLQAVCRREPGLDYLVLARPIDGVAAAEWIAPVPMRAVGLKNGGVTVAETNRFFIYACRDAA
ncbi:MAG: hypothetical protein JO258_19240 [Alphaproteobacteria bacterium]|nr:hypothetical protein [Alphaproteobacteria bacterium]